MSGGGRYDMRITIAVDFALSLLREESASLAPSRQFVAKLLRDRGGFAETFFSANSKQGIRQTPSGVSTSFPPYLSASQIRKAGRIRGAKEWSRDSVESTLRKNICLACGALRDDNADSFDGACDECAPKCSVCRSFNRPRNREFRTDYPWMGRCDKCLKGDLLRCFKCTSVVRSDEVYGRPYLYDARIDGYKASREKWRNKHYCRKCRKSLFRSIVAREREAKANVATIIELRRVICENQEQRKPA